MEGPCFRVKSFFELSYFVFDFIYIYFKVYF